MTVKELIEKLKQLDNQDALVVREIKGYANTRMYREIGDYWDVVVVKQASEYNRNNDTWYGAAYEKEEGYAIKMAVVF
jgi:hypothetical protein